MRTITTAELTAILELHKKFLRDEECARAYLSQFLPEELA